MTSREIQTQFAARGENRGGIVMFTPAIALEMIEASRNSGVAVLGLDGFWLTGKTTQPSMEHSVDYSRDLTDCWTRAADFVRKVIAPGMFVEVVLE